jgi:hypothetical protein
MSAIFFPGFICKYCLINELFSLFLISACCHGNSQNFDINLIKGLSKSAIEFSFVVSVLKVGCIDILKSSVAEIDLLYEYYVSWAFPII